MGVAITLSLFRIMKKNAKTLKKRGCKYIKTLMPYLKIRFWRYKYFHKKNTVVIFSKPSGRGDYTIYCSSIMNLANRYRRSIIMCVDPNRAEVYSCYKFPENVTLYEIKGLDNNSRVYNYLDSISKKINTLFVIGFVDENNPETKQYHSVHDIVWHIFLKQQDNVCPIAPNNIPLEKSIKAKKYYMEKGDYVIINPKTPSIEMNNGEVFFETLLGTLQDKYGLNILVNNCTINKYETLECDFIELYYYVLYAKFIISIRSGMEDFCIGTKTPMISIVPDGYEWAYLWSGLKNWKINDNVFHILYNEQNLEKCIKDIDCIVEKL